MSDDVLLNDWRVNGLALAVSSGRLASLVEGSHDGSCGGISASLSFIEPHRTAIYYPGALPIHNLIISI